LDDLIFTWDEVEWVERRDGLVSYGVVIHAGGRGVMWRARSPEEADEIVEEVEAKITHRG
jgi:hypothetical protein